VSAKALAIDPPRLFRILTSLTRRIPDLPHASAVSNRFIKPMWCRTHRDIYRVAVWEGIEMYIDPADSLGGYLAFVPQLYDAPERRAITRLLPEGGTFVDVGANIGAYSLWAARIVGPRGRVLAFEAEPVNYARLLENIALNRFNQVEGINVGVSDRPETLRLQLNQVGNAGGHSFARGAYPEGSVPEIDVQCESLAVLLDRSGVARIDFMKLDIERFEQRVLAKFFEDVPRNSPLRPRHMLTEMYPQDEKGPETLWATIVAAGYRLQWQGKSNALFGPDA
jgi:FkbM family methyltransferase